MVSKKIGLLTYQYPHLKTDQIYHRLMRRGNDYDIRVYALPFKPRKPRQPMINHRPTQSHAVTPETICRKNRLVYIPCEKDTDIDNACDFYLIMGAGILSAECVAHKKLINAHPGIVPACRGLDAFKWAIYQKEPLGVTLHYIDKEVDAGEIIAVIPTEVYKEDTLETLACRHYENEIDCLVNYEYWLEHPKNDYKEIKGNEPKMRMPRQVEEEMIRTFPSYLEQYSTA